MPVNKLKLAYLVQSCEKCATTERFRGLRAEIVEMRQIIARNEQEQRETIKMWYRIERKAQLRDKVTRIASNRELIARMREFLAVIDSFDAESA